MAKPRVLVTRPAHQAQGQTARLSNLGIEPVPLPLLEIIPTDVEDSTFPLLKSKILDLDLYHKIIFISTNAVTIGMDLIDQYWPQLPIGLDWLAIGQQTAQQLKTYGINVAQASTGYDSEALLSLPLLQDLNQQKVLIMRGGSGRKTLTEQLQQRGAQVDYADLYQRRLPHYTSEQIMSTISDKPLTAAIITSGEALLNLTQLINEYALNALENTTLVVPSERVARIAVELGYTRVITASGPDDQAMAKTVLSTIDMDDRI